MSTIQRMISILAPDLEGRDAVKQAAVIALTAMTGGCGLLFVIALFLALEPR